MANKNLKSIKFPGLTDTYVVPQVDTTLTQTGRPADAKATGDAISALGDSVDEEIDALKEDLSTLNTEGTVPTSEQMLSDNYTEDSVPYHFRKTASNTADREELEIVGGSVAWNQLERMNRASGTASNGIEFTNNGDGSFTLNGTADSLNRVLPSNTNTSAEVINGHVYLAVTNIASPSQDGVSVGIYVDTAAKRVEYKATAMYKPTSDSGPIQIGYRTAEGAVVNNLKIYGGLFDLTQMFGSTIADHIYALEQTTAGAGVSLFRSLFNKDYYPYDSGSMQSVSGLQSHKTVGKNLLELPDRTQSASGVTFVYNSKEGTVTIYGTPAAEISNRVNFTLRKGTYLFTTSVTESYSTFDSYLQDSTYTTIARGGTIVDNNRFTVPEDGNYSVMFRKRASVTQDAVFYPMIRLADVEDGTFEPYDSHSYALDDSLTLRGIPTLVDGKIKWDGDVYSPSGKVTRRYGIVDLGTLTWTYTTTSGHERMSSSTLTNSVQPDSNTKPNILCAKYIPVTNSENWNHTYDKSIAIGGNKSVVVYDTAHTDATAFKTAMSGVYLVYELATPTTETADPYIGTQICSPYGTEEFVSTGIAPIGHNTKYPDNMRMKLDGLPWNFARLIAPVEDTFKATRNYDMGRRLIVNNVLYIATANIANGANIVVGSNVRETNVDELLAELAQ